MSNYQNDFENFLNKYNVVGAVSFITDKDEILNKGVYGKQSIENNILTSKDTIYRIASISKVVVALAVMKLYEEHLIDLDEDISKYLGFKIRNEKFPEESITIRMLMTQTSSLEDCGDGIKGYYGSKAGYEFIPLEDILMNKNSIYHDENVWSLAKPGSTWSYCNLGCGILVCIVEKIKGMYFEEYIEEILLKPLDIKSGFKIENIEKINNLATHYLYDNETNTFTNYRDVKTFLQNQSKLFSLGNNYTGFAGGLYISGEDLTKIMMLLINDGTYKNIKLFKEETIKYMKQVHWQGKSYDEAYKKKGLQLIILDGYQDKPLYGHFGNAYGLRSFMLFDDTYGYIFISNGANFLSDGDHLTPLLDDMIRFMINYRKIKKGLENEENY